MLPCRMSRDQRVQDNWALLHAAEVAAKTGSPLAVAFNLVKAQSSMLRGIDQLCNALSTSSSCLMLLVSARNCTNPGDPHSCAAPLQVPEYLVAGARQFGFMLRGLKLMQPKLEALNIPFFLVKGDPIKNIPELCKKTGAACLVTDFAPLRLGREWRDEACFHMTRDKQYLDSMPWHLY